jgi:hypothetical protein
MSSCGALRLALSGGVVTYFVTGSRSTFFPGPTPSGQRTGDLA